MVSCVFLQVFLSKELGRNSFSGMCLAILVLGDESTDMEEASKCVSRSNLSEFLALLVLLKFRSFWKTIDAFYLVCTAYCSGRNLFVHSCRLYGVEISAQRAFNDAILELKAITARQVGKAVSCLSLH